MLAAVVDSLDTICPTSLIPDSFIYQTKNSLNIWRLAGVNLKYMICKQYRVL